MKRTSVTMLAVAAILLGLLAGPVAAQEVGDTFDGTSVEQCAFTVAESYRVQNPEVFEDKFEQFYRDVEAGIIDERGLTGAVVSALASEGQTLEGVCSIYLSVLPVVIDRGLDRPPVAEPTGTPAEVPSVVLGTTLARTGVDTMLLVLGGLLLFGLGFLALRRTKSDSRVS